MATTQCSNVPRGYVFLYLQSDLQHNVHISKNLPQGHNSGVIDPACHTQHRKPVLLEEHMD